MIRKEITSFLRLLDYQVMNYEIVAANSLGGSRLKNWMDIKIEQQKELIEFDMRKMIVENDAIAKLMFQSFKKGGLDKVHESMSYIQTFIESCDLTQHAFERYQKLREYVSSIEQV